MRSISRATLGSLLAGAAVWALVAPVDEVPDTGADAPALFGVAEVLVDVPGVLVTSMVFEVG